ncbi:glucans biosynthesis glucosyltransferase MdoH [Pelagibacterium montanilacus]|uniref:glucans biosynthesis glucosyltransferase MdoH n=1 Tax=Pelagibacterium montanilacus TaxID=2185280 RepID=UPI0013DFE281|nr:glucans biosynthesis glucosyltransferase MdoH [Pelagibacterium montanilacus]
MSSDLARVWLWRGAAVCAAAALSLLGGLLVLGFTGRDGIGWLDAIRSVLVAITGFWLVWGAVPAVLGALLPARATRDDADPQGRTVILVPICNEDAWQTFARIAAMNRGLVELGLAERFHFAILSDSQDRGAIAQEAQALEMLMDEKLAAGRIFYRRRTQNVARKAGNIEDFVKRSGGAYDYALILDADSLMAPATMARMAARMDREPELGLLQTVPRVIGARSTFGRVMQFASSYLSPAIARGASLFHGREGPYWGHNAILRMGAFAACCGLPSLSGRQPAGGHVLSHDYVEAALLSRGGWRVAVDAEMGGSYEEGPDDLLSYAKRDRRWCQGNLQHRRLLGAPRFRLWSRFTLLQGIMAYFASPLWLALLAASMLAAALMLPEGEALSARDAIPIWAVAAAVAAILIVPKLLVVLRGAVDGTNRRFGGTLRVTASILVEIIFSTLLAPIMLLLQSRAVMLILAGVDGGWPSTRRGWRPLGFGSCLVATWWIVACGLVTVAAVWTFALGTLLWILPATLPALLAPVLVWSSAMTGRPAGRQPFLLATEAELDRPDVLVRQQQILGQWQACTPAGSGVVQPAGAAAGAVFA